MAFRGDHPCFRIPEDRATQIWRYMDFAKLVSMLETKSLFFARADRLEDPFEGSFTATSILLRKSLAALYCTPEEQFAAQSEANELAKMWVFLNCWHINERESAAMWKLYGGSTGNQAIAIQSSLDRLDGVTSDRVMLTLVNYIDYQGDGRLPLYGGTEPVAIPEDNRFWPFVFKRRGFEHERELRAIVYAPPAPLGKSQVESTRLGGAQEGILEPVELSQLIERVFVCPGAERWFRDLVGRVLRKYDVNVDVAPSSLDDIPLY